MHIFGVQLVDYVVPVTVGIAILYLGALLLVIWLINKTLQQRHAKAVSQKISDELEGNAVEADASEKTVRLLRRLLVGVNLVTTVAALAPLIAGFIAYQNSGQGSLTLQLVFAGIAVFFATKGTILVVCLALIAKGIPYGLGTGIGGIVARRLWLLWRQKQKNRLKAIL